MKTIHVYKKLSGEEPFSKWLNSLKDKTTLARIDRRLERFYLGHEGDSKSVGEGVYELRLQFGSGYRIYYSKVGNSIIFLLCGGDKSSQTKDIEMAKQYWQELKRRSDYEPK